ncbi:MAG: ParB N-terminal domain-containing protein [Thermosynechococcaceae cyanobacterium]
MVRIANLALKDIHRPLYRQNDPYNVKALMVSIAEIGLQEPIDVLEVEGRYYGFSGCHRYEACARLGYDTIRCRIRRATPAALKMHLA